MAFKFTKQEETRRADLRDKVAEARSELDDVIAKQTAIIEDAYSEMNAAIGKYNETLSEPRGFFEDIYDEREGEYDEKSERWQEGERGEAARGWLDAIGEVKDSQLDDIEEFAFEPPAMDFEDHAEIIDNAPGEAEF